MEETNKNTSYALYLLNLKNLKKYDEGIEFIHSYGSSINDPDKNKNRKIRYLETLFYIDTSDTDMIVQRLTLKPDTDIKTKSSGKKSKSEIEIEKEIFDLVPYNEKRMQKLTKLYKAYDTKRKITGFINEDKNFDEYVELYKDIYPDKTTANISDSLDSFWQKISPQIKKNNNLTQTKLFTFVNSLLDRLNVEDEKVNISGGLRKTSVSSGPKRFKRMVEMEAEGFYFYRAKIFFSSKNLQELYKLLNTLTSDTIPYFHVLYNMECDGTVKSSMSLTSYRRWRSITQREIRESTKKPLKNWNTIRINFPIVGTEYTPEYIKGEMKELFKIYSENLDNKKIRLEELRLNINTKLSILTRLVEWMDFNNISRPDLFVKELLEITPQPSIEKNDRAIIIAGKSKSMDVFTNLKERLKPLTEKYNLLEKEDIKIDSESGNKSFHWTINYMSPPQRTFKKGKTTVKRRTWEKPERK